MRQVKRAGRVASRIVQLEEDGALGGDIEMKRRAGGAAGVPRAESRMDPRGAVRVSCAERVVMKVK